MIEIEICIFLKYLIVSQMPEAETKKISGAMYKIVRSEKGYFFKAEAAIARNKIMSTNKDKCPFLFKKVQIIPIMKKVISI